MNYIFLSILYDLIFFIYFFFLFFFYWANLILNCSSDLDNTISFYFNMTAFNYQLAAINEFSMTESSQIIAYLH
jgi:hypothetical protein